MRKLLVITPGFGLSGAPIALLNLLKILGRKNVYDITLMAYTDGELRAEYESIPGVSNLEMLDSLPLTEEFRTRLQNDYDLVFLNTALVYPFSFFFQNTDIPVFWWFHEAYEIIQDACDGFPDPRFLSRNFVLLMVSEGARQAFNLHYPNNNSIVLPVPVNMPDKSEGALPFDIPDEKVIFLIPSAYTYIKGQDILLNAIASLPEEYISQSYFIFCGYSLETQTEYKKIVCNVAEQLDNVLLWGSLDQKDLYTLMRKSHCVVAPSRLDCLPTTIVEGMMFQKLTLVSDITGISAYIKDCVNGFVFSSMDELKKRLLLIISDYQSLGKIATAGHSIYTNYYSPDAVSDICEAIGL